jgi:putative ABC transport system permease protein
VRLDDLPGGVALIKLVIANISQRKVRTILSILLIAVPVTLILTLVGLSRGYIRDSSSRMRGSGANIMVRSPDSHAGVTVSISNMPEKLVIRLREIPQVSMATGVASHLVSGWTAISGINVAEFEKMSGPFVFTEGHTFAGPDDILLDTYFARQVHAHAGSRIDLLNHQWHVAGIVQPGKLSHLFLPLNVLQQLEGSEGKVAQIYLKVDNPASTNVVMDAIQKLLPGYKVYSIDELVSLTSVDNVPFLRAFLNVIVGVAVLIAAAVASLSMYMAVQQRTREIGILKSLGASKMFVLRTVLLEALMFALGGSILGVVFSYGGRWVLGRIVPASLPQAIVPDWWPIAAAIAIGSAVLGALYPATLAAMQDPIEAIAYE